MKLIARSACVLLLLSNVVAAQEHIAWVANFPAAAALASEQRRLVLLHFYDDNCEPCLRLEQNVFNRPDVAEAVAQNYIAVKVHASRNPQLVARYRVNRWPTDVFVTHTGQEVYQRVSPQKPAEYIAILNQVAQQSGISFTRSWANPPSQTVLPASAQAAIEAEQRFSSSFGQAAQQASASAQNALQHTQDSVTAASNQFQQAADQGRQAMQHTTDTAQQGLATARQWGQDAAASAQQYQQQAHDAQEQLRQQSGQFGQQVQQQVQASRDQLTNSVTQTTQQFQQTASALTQQWQQTASNPLFDRRSSFLPEQPAPQAVPPSAQPAETSTTVAVQSSMTSNAPPLIQAPPPPPSITPSGIPLPQQNPWLTKTNPTASATPAAAAASAALQQPTASPPASPESNTSTASMAAAPASPATGPAAPSPTATPPQQPEMIPASQAPPVALDGFCPVNLLDTLASDPSGRSAWKKGDKQFGAIHRGRTYLFTSEANQQKFLSNPDAYAPALSGCDPVRYAERGEFVDGKRAYGLITRDREIYLFADEASRNRFEKSPAAFTPAIQQALRSTDSGALHR